MNMEIFPLISIVFLYFFIALIKPYIKSFNPCAICAAVSFTWLVMLVLWLTGSQIEAQGIAILMGMSITGIMYKSEKFYKENKIKNFWLVRLIIIIGGFYLVKGVFEAKWNLVLFIAVIASLSVSILSFFFQNTTHDDVLKEQKTLGRKSSLIKKLENCC
ncbi:hypothetical protein HZC20_04035 [Candidatus Peregrinibacteria bacterium]|nr:hypothetical protein [Candidatus Peregrinibacteria bacterium]